VNKKVTGRISMEIQVRVSVVDDGSGKWEMFGYGRSPAAGQGPVFPAGGRAIKRNYARPNHHRSKDGGE